MTSSSTVVCAVLVSGLFGCGASATQRAVLNRAAYDLDCPTPRDAYRSVGGTYVGRGCGKWALYTCVDRRNGDVVCAKESGPFEAK